MGSDVTGNEKTVFSSFCSGLRWKEELLRAQNQTEKRGCFDLRIECSDGHFLAHKIVFAMSTEFQWPDKLGGCMMTWKINMNLCEVSKILFLAYTGEVLLTQACLLLDDLIRLFQFPEFKLAWGVPYNWNASSSSRLAVRKLRATYYISESISEDIFIFGDGKSELISCPLEDFIKDEICGYSCKTCDMIFTDSSDLTDHTMNCIVSSAKKTTDSIIQLDGKDDDEETFINLPKVLTDDEIICRICQHRSNSVMALVEHSRIIHKILPEQDYAIRPIECQRCLFRRGSNIMAVFLFHVFECKLVPTVKSPIALQTQSIDNHSSSPDLILPKDIESTSVIQQQFTDDSVSITSESMTSESITLKNSTKKRKADSEALDSHPRPYKIPKISIPQSPDSPCPSIITEEISLIDNEIPSSNVQAAVERGYPFNPQKSMQTTCISGWNCRLCHRHFSRQREYMQHNCVPNKMETLRHANIPRSQHSYRSPRTSYHKKKILRKYRGTYTRYSF